MRTIGAILYAYAPPLWRLWSRWRCPHDSSLSARRCREEYGCGCDNAGPF
jgi:hypothetical protein